jgi:hypothetical protein
MRLKTIEDTDKLNFPSSRNSNNSRSAAKRKSLISSEQYRRAFEE